METLTATEWDVLDLTAHEAENLEQIYEAFRQSGRSVPLAETVDAIESLLRKGFLAPVEAEAGSAADEAQQFRRLWRAVFRQTADGRKIYRRILGEIHSESANPVKKPRPSLFGVWKDAGIRVTGDDIDEVRREMWANFPRDEPK